MNLPIKLWVFLNESIFLHTSSILQLFGITFGISDKHVNGQKVSYDSPNNRINKFIKYIYIPYTVKKIYVYHDNLFQSYAWTYIKISKRQEENLWMLK